MPITIEATYENGVLRPARPLPLKEKERVQVTVHDEIDIVEATRGLVRWSGDVETLNRLTMDSELTEWATMDKDLEYDFGLASPATLPSKPSETACSSP